MTTEELNAMFDKIAISQAENAAQQKRTDEQMTRNERITERNERIAERNEAKLTRMGFTLGNMANNHGESTEEYFFNSLCDEPRLGSIRFDEIIKNIHGKVARVEDEFDIAMYNGNNVALIECKYKAHENDVINLIEKKVQNFKQLFPFYANHNFYLGIASFSFYPKLEALAKENGVAILRQKGEVVEIEADNLKVY